MRVCVVVVGGQVLFVYVTVTLGDGAEAEQHDTPRFGHINQSLSCRAAQGALESVLHV